MRNLHDIKVDEWFKAAIWNVSKYNKTKVVNGTIIYYDFYYRDEDYGYGKGWRIYPRGQSNAQELIDVWIEKGRPEPNALNFIK